MPSWRELRPGQRTQVWIADVDGAEPALVFETDAMLLEAPNWTLDGTRLVMNGNGRLWTLTLTDTEPRLEAVQFDDLAPINNDHVLAPDGRHVYMSAADTHIHRGALSGGPVERVSPDDGAWHFLHGISPDGERLAYVELVDFDPPVGKLVVIEADGSTRRVDTGTGHLDGPEWSPDGEWLYVNTESFTDDPGHAQLARVPDAGGSVQRLTTSPTVDWFPHLSPDGTLATYIAFPAGTLGHPADQEVEVRLVSTADWSRPLQRHPLFGGQGTLNVNSWAPDSSRYAFVAYPID